MVRGKIFMRGDLEQRQEKMRKKNIALKEEKEKKRIERQNTLCIVCKTRQAREGSVFCSRCTARDLQNQLRDTLPGTVRPVFQIWGSKNGGTTLIGEAEVLEEAIAYYRQNKKAELLCGIRLPNGQWYKFDEGVGDGEDTVESEQNKIETTMATGPKVDLLSPPLSNEPSPVQSTERSFTRSEAAEALGISATTLLRWEKKGKIPQPRRILHNNQCIYNEELIKAARDYMAREYVAPSNGAVSPKSGLPIAAKKAVKVSRQMERAVASRIGSFGKRIF